jgi:hypothetical protein
LRQKVDSYKKAFTEIHKTNTVNTADYNKNIKALEDLNKQLNEQLERLKRKNIDGEQPTDVPQMEFINNDDYALFWEIKEKWEENQKQLQVQAQRLNEIQDKLKNFETENMKLKDDAKQNTTKIADLEKELKIKQQEYNNIFDKYVAALSLINNNKNNQIKGGDEYDFSFWSAFLDVYDKLSSKNKGNEDRDKFLVVLDNLNEIKEEIKTLPNIIELDKVHKLENTKFDLLLEILPNIQTNLSKYECKNLTFTINNLKDMCKQILLNKNQNFDINDYKIKLLIGYLNDSLALYNNINNFYNDKHDDNCKNSHTSKLNSNIQKIIENYIPQDAAHLQNNANPQWSLLSWLGWRNGSSPTSGGAPPQDDILKSPTTSSALSTLVAVTSIGSQFSITVTIVAMLVITIIFLIYLIYSLKSEKIHKYIIKYYQEDGQGEVISSGQC